MTDAELAALIATLPPCPGIPSTVEEEEAADRRALDDIEQGRFYPHALVVEWLSATNHTNLRPFEEWLASRNG